MEENLAQGGCNGIVVALPNNPKICFYNNIKCSRDVDLSLGRDKQLNRFATATVF